MSKRTLRVTMEIVVEDMSETDLCDEGHITDEEEGMDSRDFPGVKDVKARDLAEVLEQLEEPDYHRDLLAGFEIYVNFNSVRIVSANWEDEVKIIE